jgi:hypothetical protein
MKCIQKPHLSSKFFTKIKQITNTATACVGQGVFVSPYAIGKQAFWASVETSQNPVTRTEKIVGQEVYIFFPAAFACCIFGSGKHKDTRDGRRNALGRKRNFCVNFFFFFAILCSNWNCTTFSEPCLEFHKNAPDGLASNTVDHRRTDMTSTQSVHSLLRKITPSSVISRHCAMELTKVSCQIVIAKIQYLSTVGNGHANKTIQLRKQTGHCALHILLYRA